jgi:lipoyl-dependent peroxiredoxin
MITHSCTDKYLNLFQTIMVVQRSSETIWEGDLLRGNGRVKVASGSLPEFPVTWASRTEAPQGKTSPEELLAAAHASCFAMAFSATLARNRTPPERLNVKATCTFDKIGEGWKVTKMELQAAGKVAGLTEPQFQEMARKAEMGCPISNAIRNNVEIVVNAKLE